MHDSEDLSGQDCHRMRIDSQVDSYFTLNIIRTRMHINGLKLLQLTSLIPTSTFILLLGSHSTYLSVITCNTTALSTLGQAEASRTNHYYCMQCSPFFSLHPPSELSCTSLLMHSCIPEHKTVVFVFVVVSLTQAASICQCSSRGFAGNQIQ